MKTIFALLLLAPTFGFAAVETMNISVPDSKITWTGRKVGGEHTGTVMFKSGQVKMDKGAIVGGEFVVDMTTITDNDLTDKEYNKKLVDHLRSDDFFSVDKFPTATYKIDSAKADGPNKFKLDGKFTIKGMPQSVPVMVELLKDKAGATGKASLDRTLWNIKFRSGKFYEKLGDKLIKDEFDLDLKISFKK